MAGPAGEVMKAGHRYHGADVLKKVARELITVPRHPDKQAVGPADALADQLEKIQRLRESMKFVEGEKADVEIELDRLEILARQFEIAEQYPGGVSVPVPSGYARLSARAFIEKYETFIPDMVAQLDDATVDERMMRIMVHALDHYGLMSFAENAHGEPAAFRAEASAFKSLSAFRQIADAIIGWFSRSGEYDTQAAETDEKNYEQWTTTYPLATRALAKDANLSVRVVESTLKQWSDEGRAFFKVREDEETTGIYLQSDIMPRNNSERILLQWIQREGGKKDTSISATEAVHMQAVKEQFAALARLTSVARTAAARGISTYRDVPMSDFADNADMLRRAETYCWFPEPMQAVQAAAVSMFDSVRMTRDLTNGYSGWWYFQEPLAIQSNSDSQNIRAILWSWRAEGLYVSAYVDDSKTAKEVNSLVPSQAFVWTEGQTLRMAIDDFRDGWYRQYGPGGTFAYLADRGELLGVTKSSEACEQMARFFVSGCLWIQQKILEYAKGRGVIERHERKRIEREHRIDRLKDVQIIVLRRRQVVTVNDDGATRVVDWKCRWLVTGHWRNQYYPSLGAYKPKFIIPYVKGPEDMPLKVPTHRVYSVSR